MTGTTMELTRIAQTYAGWFGLVHSIPIVWTETATVGGASPMGANEHRHRAKSREGRGLPLCDVSAFWWLVIAIVALGYCSNNHPSGGSDYYDPGPDICWDSPGGAYFC